jgi:hypothetical protein
MREHDRTFLTTFQKSNLPCELHAQEVIFSKYITDYVSVNKPLLGRPGEVFYYD